MPFSHTWDATAPVDTQAANQLGADIRNLKQDIQERLAQFGSGLDASKPVPEAPFGSPSTGVVFLATDTGKFYFWNGSAWVLVPVIGGSQLIADPSDNVVTNPGLADTPLNSVTILQNTLTVGELLLIHGYGQQTATGGAAVNTSNKLAFGPTNLAAFALNNQNYDFYFDAVGQVTAVGASGKVVIGTKSMVFFGNNLPGGGAFVDTPGSMFELAVDTTAPIQVTVSASGMGVFQSKGLFVRLLK